MTVPNPKNFCGGNYQDWLEVYLTGLCNGKCPWCVDKDGYKPDVHIDCDALAEKIIQSGKTKVILLGGEPTLYKPMGKLISSLTKKHIQVYLTTNGSILTRGYVKDELRKLAGINISLHHYDLDINRKITGVEIKYSNLVDSINELNNNYVNVRFNCNLIKGYIDNLEKIKYYVFKAKYIGVDSIRFAELKSDKENFINLARIFDYQYGLNVEPFTRGCVHETEIDGVKINFRQMCGLQTPLRPKPVNPVFKQFKRVMYYDGVLHNDWMKEKIIEKEKTMDKNTENRVIKILKLVEKKEIDVEDALVLIERAMPEKIKIKEVSVSDGGSCRY